MEIVGEIVMKGNDCELSFDIGNYVFALLQDGNLFIIFIKIIIIAIV